MKRIVLLLTFIALLFPIFAQETAYLRELTDEELKPYLETKQKNVDNLVAAAISIVDSAITYDQSYVRIAYPMGDVPANTGVCTDVIIRAFRKGLNRDLQKEIYEYRKWLKNDGGKPDLVIDRNIDHRRVRCIMEMWDAILSIDSWIYNDFDGKYGRDLTKCEKGDIIVYDLGSGILHIAICISDKEMVHNIGRGQVIDPIYTDVPIIRNYRLWEPREIVLDNK